MPRLVLISDTHGRHADTVVPDGDILVHSGDLTLHGSIECVKKFDDWLGTLPHPHKVVVAGNHDWCFQRWPGAARAALTNAIYLQDEAAEVAGLKFYGSPWQPWFFDWAFNLARGPEIAAKWALIPHGLDVLVTHGPPLGFGDVNFRGYPVGCADLAERIQVVRPKLHVFGHIHEAAGVYPGDGTLHVNASTQMGRGTGVAIDILEDGTVRHVV